MLDETYPVNMENKDLRNAIYLALTYHNKQEDKAGKLYILHPLHVMLQMTTIEEQIVAVLHDTVEDTDLTLQTLHAFDFSQQVVNAVDAISKRKGETNKEYWNRIKACPLATKVKMKDMEHNSSPERISCLSYGEQEYLTTKYAEMREFFNETTKN